jgi:hypothetical protein
MSEIISYIQSLELPPAVRRGPSDKEPPPAFKSVAQAVTVGSQMAEFSSKVPQSIRPAISNGLLLGQLAADKAMAGNPDPMAWFRTFNSVMKRIGWQSTLSELNEQTISDENAALHKAIIPLVTAIFGPGAAASSIIIAVLKGLESMDQDAPWITVFEQKSNKVHAANFGLSYVDSGAEGGATLKTAYFSLQGSQVTIQILFFKFASSDAKIKSGQCQMSLSAQTISISEAVLQQKVAPFIIDNIKNINI